MRPLSACFDTNPGGTADIGSPWAERPGAFFVWEGMQMEYRFETTYDWKGLTALNHVLRQTVKKRRGRTVTFFCWVAAALGALLLIRQAEAGTAWTSRQLASCAAVVILLAVPFVQDWIRGYFAWRNLPRDKARAVGVFTEKDWTFSTKAQQDRLSYEDITCSCETKGYFVLLLEGEDARLCAKEGLTGGTAGELAAFLSRKTGRPVVQIP